MKKTMPNHWAAILLSGYLLVSCIPAVNKQSSSPTATSEISPIISETPTNAAPTPTLQPLSSTTKYGPNPDNFPKGINPLTGEPVIDPTLLQVPALLVSVSNFPVTARPQSGLSFAPLCF